MTYDYTDKELNVLNREGYVYSVNPDVALKSKTKHKVITDKRDEELSSKETNTVRIGSQDFRVVSVKNDPATGFQGMAVAPIVNGQVDTNSVVVVVAGTMPTDVNDLIFILRKK